MGLGKRLKKKGGGKEKIRQKKEETPKNFTWLFWYYSLLEQSRDKVSLHYFQKILVHIVGRRDSQLTTSLRTEYGVAPLISNISGTSLRKE